MFDAIPSCLPAPVSPSKQEGETQNPSLQLVSLLLFHFCSPLKVESFRSPEVFAALVDDSPLAGEPFLAE